MPSSLRQRRQRRSRQQKRGGRLSRRGVPSVVPLVEEVAMRGGRRRGSRRLRRGEPSEQVAVLSTGDVVPVNEVQSDDVVKQVVDVPADQVEQFEMGGGRSRRLRRGRRASRAAQRGGRAVSLKTAVRLLRNYYAKRYA